MSAKERWRRRALAWEGERGNRDATASETDPPSTMAMLAPFESRIEDDGEFRALQVSVHSLEIEVIEKRLEILRLSEENKELDKQLSTWRGEWAEEQAHLEEQIAGLQQEREGLIRKLEERAVHLADSSTPREELTELRQEVARLHMLRKSHSQALENLEKENRRLRREIRTVEGELNRTRHRMENRQIEDKEISERLNFLDQEVEVWRLRCRDRDDDVDLLRAEILGFRSLVSEKESSLADQDLRQRRQEREIESLKRELVGRKKAFEEAEILLIAQGDELDRALTQLSETQDLAEARHASSADLTLLLDKTRKEIAAKEARIAELEETLKAESASVLVKEAKLEIEHWRREAEQHERQSIVLQANLQQARAYRGGSVFRELEASRHLVDNYLKTLGEREDELEALRIKYAERTREQAELLGKLEELESLRRCERDSAALRLTRTKELARDQTNRVEILQEKYDELTKQLTNQDRRFEGLRARQTDREIRLENELEGRRVVLEELQRRIVCLEADQRSLKSTITQRDLELARLRERLRNEEPTEADLSMIRRQLQDVAAELQQKIEELES